MYLRHKHAADGRGQADVMGVQSRRHTVHGYRRCSGKTPQKIFIHIQIELIDNQVDKNERGKHPHLFQERKIRMCERKRNMQVMETIYNIRREMSYCQDSCHHYHTHRAISHNQQGKREKRIQDILQNRQRFLKKKAFVCRSNRRKHTIGKRERHIPDHEHHQDRRGGVLRIRQAVSKNRMNMDNHDGSAKEAKQRHHKEDREEHPVKARQLPFVSFLPDSRVIADIRAGKAQTQQAKISSNRINQCIEAIFTLSQKAQHDGGVKQTGKKLNELRQVGQQYARFSLTFHNSLTFLLVFVQRFFHIVCHPLPLNSELFIHTAEIHTQQIRVLYCVEKPILKIEFIQQRDNPVAHIADFVIAAVLPWKTHKIGVEQDGKYSSMKGIGTDKLRVLY